MNVRRVRQARMAVDECLIQGSNKKLLVVLTTPIP